MTTGCPAPALRALLSLYAGGLSQPTGFCNCCTGNFQSDYPGKLHITRASHCCPATGTKLEGRLVGLSNVKKIDPSDRFGYAAPSNIVRAVYEQIRAGGSVRRGVLGMSTRTITPQMASALKLPDARVLGPHGLLIIMGDHQPLAEVAGEDASHDVPIHVISREADLVGPFEARGYVEGWVPPRGRVLGMEDFLPAFVEDFGPDE